MLAASDPNAAIHAPASVEQAVPGDFVERGARLVTILLVARLVTPAGDTLARVRNLSSGGMLLETSVALATGDAVRVELRNLQALAGRVAWTRNGRAGIQFDAPANIADLLHPPAPRGRNARVPRAPRLSTCCPIQVQHGGRSCRTVLLDLSQKGGCFQAAGVMAVNDQVTVCMPGLPPQRGVVRWLRDDRTGIVFLDTIPFGELDRWLQNDAVRFAGRSDPA